MHTNPSLNLKYTIMSTSFYSPAVFNSASPVFQLHVNSIVTQQRIDSLNSVSKLSTDSCVIQDMSFDPTPIDCNPTLHVSLMMSNLSLRKYSITSFIQAVMLHNHNRNHYRNINNVASSVLYL